MGILKKLSKIWGKLSSGSKFMAHYADEASDLAEVLRHILPALPLGREAKVKVTALIDKLDKAADNITEFLDKGGSLDGSGPKAAPTAKTTREAVADYLDRNPDVLREAVANAAAAALVNGQAGDGDGKAPGENSDS